VRLLRLARASLWTSASARRAEPLRPAGEPVANGVVAKVASQTFVSEKITSQM
jgi:hypothetical protein